ncbi:MAG: DUF2950 domain-containing protein [Candidatus Eremiobacteraeota bacterium]|nr:DUF2950 domain-containing protein [Candidatus Eremiobacteraeota bacterium]
MNNIMRIFHGKALTVAAAALLIILAGTAPLRAQDGAKIFASPDEAAKALIDACQVNDMKALFEILGPAAKAVLVTSDRAADEMGRKKFQAAAAEHMHLEKAGAAKVTMVIGKNKWPFPIPLVKGKEGWSFDSKAGREEIVNRRIGKNELNAIAVCCAYVDAQRHYASKDRMGKGILEYAQKVASSPGRKDGLYWPAKENQELSPFGPFIVSSSEYQAARKQGDPYYGYYFRILKAQGPKALGGAFNYVINGHMLAGFALVAYPADYGTSGVMTFVVNQWGRVFEKDLGKDTGRVAGSMKEYNPDGTWSAVKDKGALATE